MGLLPAAVDVVLSEPLVGSWRRHLTAGLSGRVLEFGFGSGPNLPHYPPSVSEVLAIEPRDDAWSRAVDRMRAASAPSGMTQATLVRVERIGLDAASVPLPDASVDFVVSSWTLCTIPDLDDALAEARRVLRPGGALRFVEHTRSPSATVARWQDRIQPFWGPVAGGCHTNRDIVSRLADAGFEVSDLLERDLGRWFFPVKPWAWFVSGTATPTSEL